MNLKIVTGISLLFICKISLASSACVLSGANNQLLNLKDAAENIEKKTQIAFAKESPADFCKRNMLLRYINANPKDSSASGFQCIAMGKEDLEKYADQVFAISIRKDEDKFREQPWLNSLVLVDRAQKFSSIDHKFYYDGLPGLDQQYDKELNQRVDLLQKPAKSINFQDSLYDQEGTKPATSELLRDTIAMGKVCSDLNILNSIGCARALSRATEISRPQFFQKVAYQPVDVWRKVTSSPDKYADGLRRIALNLTQKLKAKDTGKSNILGDMKVAFVQSGMSEVDATDAAYDVLALYGNSGANLGLRAFKLAGYVGGRQTIANYLSIIGTTIPALDYENMKQGKKLYSLPPEVDGQCNTNKSYHFWMSAYLARRLMKEGFDPESAKNAVYAASIGYQINRNQGVESGKTGDAALSKTSYDPVTNVIRADLSYAASGARYAVGESGVSVDKTLVNLLENSTPTIKSTDKSSVDLLNQLDKYNRFTDMVAPKSALK